MSQSPPPVVNQTAWSQPPKERNTRTLIVVVAIAAFLVIVVIGIATVLPMLTPKPNLRPDTYPPRVISKVGDGWLDMKFFELGVTVRVPGKPAAGTVTLADVNFNRDFASDYIEYASTGDACVIIVGGIWLTPEAADRLAKPGALSQLADENFLNPAVPIEVKGLPAGAEARFCVKHAPGYPPNNSIVVYLMRKKNLIVEIMVNNDGPKEQSLARIEKALKGFRLNEFEE